MFLFTLTSFAIKDVKQVFGEVLDDGEAKLAEMLDEKEDQFVQKVVAKMETKEQEFLLAAKHAEEQLRLEMEKRFQAMQSQGKHTTPSKRRVVLLLDNLKSTIQGVEKNKMKVSIGSPDSASNSKDPAGVGEAKEQVTPEVKVAALTKVMITMAKTTSIMMIKCLSTCLIPMPPAQTMVRRQKDNNG